MPARQILAQAAIFERLLSAEGYAMVATRSERTVSWFLESLSTVIWRLTETRVLEASLLLLRRHLAAPNRTLLVNGINV